MLNIGNYGEHANSSQQSVGPRIINGESIDSMLGAISNSQYSNQAILSESFASTVSATTEQNNEIMNVAEDEKPKRPLSAYNFFFQQERLNILATKPVRAEGKPRRSHGKMNFATMARTIADKWNSLDPSERKPFEIRARAEKLRYKRELAEWKKRQNKQRRISKTDKKKSAPSRSKMNNDFQGTMQIGLARTTSQSTQDSTSTLATNGNKDSLSSDEETRLQTNMSRLAYIMEEDCVSQFVDLFQEH